MKKTHPNPTIKPPNFKAHEFCLREKERVSKYWGGEWKVSDSSRRDGLNRWGFKCFEKGPGIWDNYINGSLGVCLNTKHRRKVGGEEETVWKGNKGQILEKCVWFCRILRQNALLTNFEILCNRWKVSTV